MITPDYDLFIRIFFIIWILKGAVLIIRGLLQADRPACDKYDTTAVAAGILILGLALWVVIG